jgi:hypothetical protein
MVVPSEAAEVEIDPEPRDQQTGQYCPRHADRGLYGAPPPQQTVTILMAGSTGQSCSKVGRNARAASDN